MHYGTSFGGPVAKILCSQCRELGLDPRSRNCIQYATKSFHAAAKDLEQPDK